jgi:outer membrane protein OmpA-like peptidoglycan-associated protein
MLRDAMFPPSFRVATARVALLAVLALLGACAGPAKVPTKPATAARASAPVEAVAEGLWLGGSAARDAQRHLALAAGVAALPPASVGYYVDVHEARLRERLAGSGAEVRREGLELRVLLPLASVFATGSAVPSQQARPTVDALAAVLQKFDKTVLQLAVDSDGREAAAARLAAERCVAVSGVLRGRGVESARIALADHGGRGRSLTLTISPLLK